MTTKLKSLMLTAAAVSGLAIMPAAFAQGTVTIHGHANDEVGQPVADGMVEVFKSGVDITKEKPLYTFQTDANGDYTGKGIEPGAYTVALYRGKTLADYQKDQDLKADANQVENFDMSRAEYIAALSPERRKQIEEFKAKNASISAANKDIKGLNATMTSVRADLKSPSPNFDKDIADSKSALGLRPNEPLLYVLYGDSLQAKADHDAAADRANKTNPLNDDAVKQSYADSIAQYKKALELADADPKKNPTVEATILNQMGNAQAHSGAGTDAVASYDKAATIDPKSAGLSHRNAAAVLFNAHQDDPALDEANKAIAADPDQPLPYYIKGQLLLAKSSVDKAGKIVPPPGCVDAYNKYLELAPDGPQAPAVKDSLTALGEKVQTHYSAKKGH